MSEKLRCLTTGVAAALSSLHVVTQSDSLTQYEKEKKQQQLTPAPPQVTHLDWFYLFRCTVVSDSDGFTYFPTGTQSHEWYMQYNLCYELGPVETW